MAATMKLFFACLVYCIVIDRVASLQHKYPTVIVFGDSIVDPGNNNYLVTVAKCNFPPYGRDFEGGKPTGRFSNGKVPSDFFVEAFGLKQFVPPYLDPNLRTEDLLTGVSFASGGAGYDPFSAQSAGALTLNDQLRLFEDYKVKLKVAVGEERTKSIVSESLYLVVAGSNDITNTYYLAPFRRAQYDINSYTDLLVHYASTFLQDLYRSGARNIGILSAPPAGCLPSQRTLAGGPGRECVEKYNYAAILYNSKLVVAIHSLKRILPEAQLVYLDIYTPVIDLINNPTKQGFEVADKGCCGSGKIESTIVCTQCDPRTCEDASKYVFWDSFHPTQRTYEILVRQILKKSYNVSLERLET